MHIVGIRACWCRSTTFMVGILWIQVFGKTSWEIAVKMLRNDDMKERSNFMNEAATMSQLNHKRLVKLYGVCSMGKQMKIVTELLEGGSLLQFLRSITTSLTSRFMLNIALQVPNTLLYEANSFNKHNFCIKPCYVPREPWRDPCNGRLYMDMWYDIYPTQPGLELTTYFVTSVSLFL